MKAYSIYWICKKSDLSIPWYVGITTNMLRRWKEHQDNFLYRSNPSVLKHLINDVANDNLVIRRVETIYCTRAEAIIAERNAISDASRINPDLLNVQNKTAEASSISVVRVPSLFPVWVSTHQNNMFDEAFEFINEWKAISCQSLHGDVLAIQLAMLDAFWLDLAFAKELTEVSG